MYTFLVEAHSGWRWIVLLILVVATIKVLIGWLARQRWTNLDTNLVRITNGVVTIQVLLGIILYLVVFFQGLRGDLLSFFLSHALPAILALGGVGFALARSRKAAGDNKKFMFASIGMIIAVILIYGALATVGGIFAS